MKTKLSLLAVAAMCVISNAAVAGGHRQVPPVCQADAAKLCPGLTPGDHKFGPCMREHKAQVSDACRAAVKEHRDNRDDKPGKPGRPGGPSVGPNS